jgi:hypothetical protein
MEACGFHGYQMDEATSAANAVAPKPEKLIGAVFQTKNRKR